MELLYAARDDVATGQGRLKAQNWCDLPSGARRYLALEAVLVRDVKGRIAGVVETLQDMTELKVMEEDLNRAKLATQDAIERERELVLELDRTRTVPIDRQGPHLSDLLGPAGCV